MDNETILDRLNFLGVSVTPAEGSLRLEPGSRVPPELVEELRQHKQEILALLNKKESTVQARVAQHLQEALRQKEKEIALCKRDLASPYYAGDPWCLEQIRRLERQCLELQRYLKEGGALALPQCSNQQAICLAATRGFTSCIWEPDSCYYSLWRGSNGQ